MLYVLLLLREASPSLKQMSRRCCLYSQVPNKHPHRLLIFRVFPTPRTLLGPPSINFKEIDFFTNPSFHFLSLLVLFTPNI